MQREHAQAIVKIAAKRARGDHFGEVAICGGHQADIHANRLRAAQSLKLLFLKNAQKFGLQLERDIADFVQKNRAAVRQLEPADALRDRSGKRAALVPEQFRFEQAGGNRGAIDFDERAFAPRAQIVDRAGDQFLARAGFAR